MVDRTSIEGEVLVHDVINRWVVTIIHCTTICIRYLCAVLFRHQLPPSSITVPTVNTEVSRYRAGVAVKFPPIFASTGSDHFLLCLPQCFVSKRIYRAVRQSLPSFTAPATLKKSVVLLQHGTSNKEYRVLRTAGGNLRETNKVGNRYIDIVMLKLV